MKANRENFEIRGAFGWKTDYGRISVKNHQKRPKVIYKRFPIQSNGQKSVKIY